MSEPIARLAYHRAQAGLTQADLAAKSGVSPATIQRLESLKHGAHLRTLYRLAKALNVGIGDLLEDSAA